LASAFSALALGLKSSVGRWIIGIVTAFILVMLFWNKYQSILLERDRLDTQYKEVKAALENKDKEYNILKSKYEKVKTHEVTTTHTLPSGETTTTTSRYTESETGSTERNTGKETTNYPPGVGQQPQVRAPVAALGIVSTQGWNVGLGYEALTLQLPFIPYRLHGTLGIAGGLPWESKDNAFVVSGVFVAQFSKRK
jgi:hypothetical protein